MARYTAHSDGLITDDEADFDNDGPGFSGLDQPEALARILNTMDETAKMVEQIKAQVGPMLEQVAPMLSMFGLGGK